MQILTCGFRSVAALMFSDAARRVVVLNAGGLGPSLEVHHLHSDQPPSGTDSHPPGRWVTGFSDADERMRFVPHTPTGSLPALSLSVAADTSVGINDTGTRAVVALTDWRANVPHLRGYSLRNGRWHPTWTREVSGFYDGPVCYSHDDKRFVIRRREEVLVRTRMRMETRLVVCAAAGGRELGVSQPVVGEVQRLAAVGASIVLSVDVGHWGKAWSILRVYAGDSVDAGSTDLPQKGIVTALAADLLGRFLLSASGAKVTVWDPVTWKPLRAFDWTIGRVTCLAVSADGTLAAAGGDKGKAVVWDVE